MKNVNLLVLNLIVVSVFFILYSCDIVQQTDYKGSIKGWVYDDSTRMPLSNVYVSSTEFPLAVLTNDSGMFLLYDLSMGTSSHTFQITLEKTAYQKLLYSALCKNGEITYYDSIFMKRDTL